MKKGYVISLAVVIILLVLSLLSIQIISFRYSEYSIIRNQIFADKAAFVVNDVLMDIRKVLSVSQNANSSIVSVSENYSYNKSAFLSNEQARLSEFANLTAVNISLTPPSPASVMNISFTNGMVYVTNETDQTNKEIRIYNYSGTSLNASGYVIHIVSNVTRGAYIEPSNASSGIVVTVNYTDPISPKSFVSTRVLDPSSLSVWRINLPNPSQNITVSFGLIGGKSGSLSVRQYGVNAIRNIRTDINLSKTDVEGTYNIFLNVSSQYGSFADYLKIR